MNKFANEQDQIKENPNINIDNNQGDEIDPGNINIDIKKNKKKNRTLQYYKFLFYTIKLEIKSQDFVKLIHLSNESEILLWVLSFILFLATPKKISNLDGSSSKIKYKSIFLIFHLIHVARAVIGFFIWIHLPRSYQVPEVLKNVPENRLEKCLFNDLAREQIKNWIIEPLKKQKILFIIYAILTFINFFFDCLDFLIVLANLDKATSNTKVILLSYQIIAFLYCIIDLSYIFWAGSLKFILPKEYLLPITNAFSGSVNKVLRKFKLTKSFTDVKNDSNVSDLHQNNRDLPMMKDAIVSNKNNENNNNDIVNDNEIKIDL